MEIRICSLLRGAQEAEGTVIVIDVFRAFTTGAVAFSRGAEKIILVAEVAEALELKSRGVGEICIGEVAGIRPEGFDLGNSPYDMSKADVDGKALIQSTRAGTVGMTAVTKADQIYAGSFAIAAALAIDAVHETVENLAIDPLGPRCLLLPARGRLVAAIEVIQRFGHDGPVDRDRFSFGLAAFDDFGIAAMEFGGARFALQIFAGPALAAEAVANSAVAIANRPDIVGQLIGLRHRNRRLLANRHPQPLRRL